MSFCRSPRLLAPVLAPMRASALAPVQAVALRALLIVALAAVLLGTTARPASAHALYEKSQPATGGQLETPGQIQVSFTEDVEPQFSQLEVLDTSRRKVDLDDSHSPPGSPKALTVSVPQLPDGTYMVAWRALSAVDGHVTRGVFPLVVGAGGLDLAMTEAPAYVPGAPDVLARWVGYAAAVVLAGGLLFRLLIAGPALRRVPVEGLEAIFDQRLSRWGLIASVALLLATLLGMVSQAANAADRPIWQALGEPVMRLLTTRLGLLWELRLACGLLLALVFWRVRGPLQTWIGLPLGLTLLMAISLGSHAAAIPSGTWLAVLLDWLHQVAAAAWVGGLVAFVLLLRLARAQVDGTRNTPLVCC
jgi:methionine-rich copper-binding protein CopC